MMINSCLIFIKTIWQIFLYALEVIGISYALAYFSTFLNKTESVYDFIERIIMFYTLYQIFVLIILTNLNDIKKDSCLAYISLIKKVLLYHDTRQEFIKRDIIKNIEYQLDNGTLNNNEYRKSYEIIKQNIDEILKTDKSYIEMELINAEHRYEFISLNWRFSFLLRLFK